MFNFREKFCNKPLPANYEGSLEEQNSNGPSLELNEPLRVIDGVTCRFLGLILDSGVLECDHPFSDYDVEVSSEDEEIEIIPVQKKPPPFIDLQESSNGVVSSDNESHAPEKTSTPPPPISLPTQVAQANQDSNHLHSGAKQSTHDPKNKSVAPPKTKNKGKPTTKKRKESSTGSEEDSHSSSRVRRRKKSCRDRNNSRSRSRSRSHSLSRNEKRDHQDIFEFVEERKYKDEYYGNHSIKQEYNLYGNWYCNLCKITMTSEGTYSSHMQGKRHAKALNQKNLERTISQIPAAGAMQTLVSNRYPVPPANIVRTRSSEEARSQKAIEHALIKNGVYCPGLEYVFEIQGLKETTYYCGICDAPCNINSIIPHLIGHKHKLGLFEHFEPKIYEVWKSRRKTELDRKANSVLLDVQKQYGLGTLTVEKDFEKDETYPPDVLDARRVIEARRESSRRGVRREDTHEPSHKYDDDVYDPDKPITSMGDLYCKLCDAHMNNIQMWEAHLIGKRHEANKKNKKKDPRQGPSKVKNLKIENMRPRLLDQLEKEGITEPIVGLDYLKETQSESLGARYNCYLCGACMTHIDVIPHLISQKHRIKYLEKIKNQQYQLLSNFDFQEKGTASIILEICQDVEKERGRGNVDVYVPKSWQTVNPGCGRP